MIEKEPLFDVEVTATAQVTVKKTVQVRASSESEAQMLAEAACVDENHWNGWKNWTVETDTVRNLSSVKAQKPTVSE